MPTRLLLAAALLFVVLIGGTDAGRYLTVVRAGMALVGALFVIIWLVRAPREADRVDLLVLGSLLLFLLTCVLSDFRRFSLDAGISAMAVVAALFVARRAVATARDREFAVTVLGLMGIVISLVFVMLWGALWIRWISTAGGLPPLDLILPVGPYRHFHVVGMTVALLLPAVAALARRPVIWPVAWIGLTAGAVVILMSGSRTVWLALAVVGLALGFVHAKAISATARRALSSKVALALAVAVGAGGLVLVSSLAPRLMGTSTIRLRLALWDATVDRWLQDPLFGSGPGSFGSSLALGDFFTAHDGIGRHADNAPVQLLAEGGLVGLLGIGLLAVAAVIGVRRSTALAPITGLGMFVLMSLTDNPSDSAHLVVIAVVWFALATPASATESLRQTTWLRIPTAVAATAVGGAVVLALVASTAFDGAARAAADGDVRSTVRQLTTASGLDPGNALYARTRAVWLLAAGRPSEGTLAIGRAVALNPGDATAWRVAAFAAHASGDREAAIEFARRAVELRAVDPANALMLAWVAGDEGEAITADALDIALRFHPWTTAALDWTSNFGPMVGSRLDSAQASWLEAPDRTGRWTRARAWLAAMVARPLGKEELSVSTTAASAVIECRTEDAIRTVDDLRGSEAVTADSLLARVLVARASGSDADEEVQLAAIRWPVLGYLASVDVPGQSPLIDPGEDQRLYSRQALPAPPLGPVFPTSESGLSAWLRDPGAAADRGAPESGLARCR